MDEEHGVAAPDGSNPSACRARLRSPGQTSKAIQHLRPHKLTFILFVALAARIFTNLEAVPPAEVVAMSCLCILAEVLERFWCFALCLLPMGIALGLSCWGYLQAAALLIGVVGQLILGLAYTVHRALARRHPEVWPVIFAFPCVHTALWALGMVTLPIGSTASPVYSAAEWPILLQTASWLGRSAVTFLLSLAAAGAAHFFATGKRRSLEVGFGVLLAAWLAGGVRFYSSTFFVDLSKTGPGGAPAEYYHVSCLNDVDSIYDETKRRLAAGDTVIIHSERATDNTFYFSDSESESYVESESESYESGPDSYVERYRALLESNFNASGNRTEAVVVLSFVGMDDRSWYHLVSRHGSEMSYAKNHPVPFVETDIVAGTSPPSVASVVIGDADSEPIAVTGSICFDTDFPLLTRRVSGADLFLETSETWANIGWQHLQGHKLAAVENGQTLIKCTDNGYTGAIGRFGSIIYEVPGSQGTLSFSVPRYPGLAVFTPLYGAFEAVMGCLAAFWILLAVSPALSTKFLSQLCCRSWD